MGRSKKSFDRVLSMYKHKNLAFKMTNWPVIGPIGQKLMDSDNMCLTYIPVNQDLSQPESSAAPVSIIEHFVEKAVHHVILSRCPCRSENDCKDYPGDLGCLFIGAAAREVDPEVGYHVTKEEALDHLHKAVEMGLIPCLGRFKGDAIMLGVKDHAHLMTICMCCPCCCISTAMSLASEEARSKLIKLEGVEVTVDTEKCNGCKLCIESCIFNQIEIKDGKAVIGEECKGCGRCVSVCKRKAITLTIDNPNFVEECINRLGDKVDVTWS